MPEFIDKLAELLDKSDTLPFLFVGSGLSRRYLGLQDWQGLLRHFCEKANIPGRRFSYYFSSVGGKDHLPKLASMMARDLHDIWWQEDRFKDIIQKHEELDNLKDFASPLKIEISEFIDEKSTDHDVSYQDEIEQLSKVAIDGIITTNWDKFLENVFDYRIYIGQEDLLSQRTQAVGEIYKIHGCCSAPNSLVLTAEDYAGFNKRNSYLAAKLLTVFVEHPVIFLGYSMTDENIKEILFAILSCMKAEQITQLQDRLIFVRRPKDDEIEGCYLGTIYGNDANTIPVTEIRTHNYAEVYKVLQRKRRPVSPQILRSIKEELYKIILTANPQDRLITQRISDETDFSKTEFVFGLGVIDEFAVWGYGALTREVVCEDIIFGTKKLKAEAMVTHNLPSFVRKGMHYPVFKYLEEFGGIKDGHLEGSVDVPERLLTFCSTRTRKGMYNEHQRRNVKSLREKHPDIQSVLELSDVSSQLRILPVIEYSEDDIEVLRQYLCQHFEDKKTSSDFCKLVCIYDLLRYGPVDYRE